MTQYRKILNKIDSSVLLVAVTKNRSIEEMQTLYQEGARDFGESYVQDLLEKAPHFPQDVRWHFIGTLQKNKVQKILGITTLIHSVDSIELADKISLLSVKKNCVTSLLIQVNTSKETSKHGYSREEWFRRFPELMHLPALKIQGLMTMAPETSNQTAIRQAFIDLRSLKESLEKKYLIKLPILSMGMSQDYSTAIEERSTMIRIGTALFAGE